MNKNRFIKMLTMFIMISINIMMTSNVTYACMEGGIELIKQSQQKEHPIIYILIVVFIVLCALCINNVFLKEGKNTDNPKIDTDTDTDTKSKKNTFLIIFIIQRRALALCKSLRSWFKTT